MTQVSNCNFDHRQVLYSSIISSGFSSQVESSLYHTRLVPTLQFSLVIHILHILSIAGEAFALRFLLILHHLPMAQVAEGTLSPPPATANLNGSHAPSSLASPNRPTHIVAGATIMTGESERAERVVDDDGEEERRNDVGDGRTSPNGSSPRSTTIPYHPISHTHTHTSKVYNPTTIEQ